MNNWDTPPSIAEKFTEQFKQKCTNLIDSGFQKLKKTNNFDPNWKEEKFTEELYKVMNSEVESHNYPHIDVDFENYGFSHATGELVRVDFKISRATERNNIYAYLEAKLLSDDSDSIYRYRREGIIRFVSGKYASRPKYDGGFMVGYVIVNGIDDVIDRLTPSVNGDGKLNIVDPLKHVNRRDGLRILESKHGRIDGLDSITLTHVLLDFS